MLVKSYPLLIVDRWTVGSLTWIYCDPEGWLGLVGAIASEQNQFSRWGYVRLTIPPPHPHPPHQFSPTSSGSSWKPWETAYSQPSVVQVSGSAAAWVWQLFCSCRCCHLQNPDWISTLDLPQSKTGLICSREPLWGIMQGLTRLTSEVSDWSMKSHHVTLSSDLKVLFLKKSFQT